ncbi:Transcription factor GTE3 [Phytophthora cinnamomi]|uniref:Transcription factor GTE3 n=1 Tax=Phytophthora cinnamomi TaxID=4785 RepID=UPI00355A2332|nr:Transcription factor GTE3 [Phytophthora cinnamomi]
MDKARLSSDIKLLPQDKINRVLQIIAEAVPVAKLANENDEVELDINAFDTRCLRMLEGYVRENGIGRKRKRPAKIPTALGAPSLSQLDPSASTHAVDAAKKIRDEQLSNAEPLRVENRGAWSMLAKKETLTERRSLTLMEARQPRLALALRAVANQYYSSKQQEEAEGSRLRCLRSDLRLLQDFRVRYFRQSGEKDPALLSAIEEETKQLKAFLDKNAKKEKMGGKQEQSALVLELFEMRRDITSRISEDLLKEKNNLTSKLGIRKL